jgi:hypothetical protein
VNLYHGGVPGKRIGDLIVPGHSRDDRHRGCPICEARANGRLGVDPPTLHSDRVYVTANRLYARYYASLYGRGDLYLVIPEGDIERSDEDPFECYYCESARVSVVIDRSVLLRPSERRKAFLQHAKVDGLSKREASREFDRMLSRLGL